ncbi:MAG: tetratricopeptide repeat protein [Chthoniobacterales bacterium]
MIYYKRADYERALNDFQDAVQCAPNTIASLLMRGRCYLVLNDLEGSLARFDAAIAMEPGSIQAYRARARVYERRGEPDKSRHDLDEAKRLAKAVKERPSAHERSNESSDADREHGHSAGLGSSYYLRLRRNPSEKIRS